MRSAITFAAIKTKPTIMKKLFAILAIAGVVTACNNASEGTTSADSTVVATDSTAAPVTDTATAPAATDSTSGNSDSVGAASTTSTDTATAK